MEYHNQGGHGLPVSIGRPSTPRAELSCAEFVDRNTCTSRCYQKRPKKLTHPHEGDKK